jgi:hypothetical protein
MASTHKHIRSGTANKRPTTAIADGQIALNTNTTSPGLYFKDSTGASIIKVGPVHVGSTAPNVTPPTGGSSGNSAGEVWLDTSLTPAGVKIWDGSAWVNATPVGSTTVQGLLELATSAETQAGSDTDRAVTPAGLQSKLSDSTSTTSSTTIASSTAVKAAYDLAAAALPKSGGTITGNLEIGTSGSLTFEGATADAFETTLAVVDPTADRTITLPNTTGTVVTTGDTGTVTSTMLLDGTVVDADINANAEIAVSKLADGAARQLLQTDAAGTGVEWASNIDIPGTLDVTSAATFDSSVAVTGALTKSGNNVVTVGDTGTVTSTMLLDGTILNADVNASAAIAGTKISPDFGSQTIVTTGVHSAAAGTAAAPSITFTGDLNTGIYSPGADQVAISTSGTGRLFVDSAGKVGIGTTPNAIFEVAGSETVLGTNHHVTQYLTSTKAYNATPGGGLALYYKYNSANAYTYGAGVSFEKDNTSDGDYGSHLTLQTRPNGGNATERLRITSAGLVGLGTSSPSYTLDVVGTHRNSGIYFNSNDTPQGTAGTISRHSTVGLITRGITASVFDWSVYSAGGTAILANPTGTNKVSFSGGEVYFTGGNVGIGTTSPTTKLQVGAGNPGADTSIAKFQTGDANVSALTVSNWTGTGTSYGPKISFDNSTRATWVIGGEDGGGSFIFKDTTSGNNERLRIDSSGRLLVGTSTAASSGTYSALALIRTQGNSSSATTWSSINIARGQAATAPILVEQDIGIVSFSDSAGYEFATIRCMADAQSGANDYPGRLVFSTTLDGASSPTERMRITNAGRVMIGTTTDPGYQTSIVGSSAYALYVRQDIGNYTYPVATFYSNFSSGDNKLVDFYTDTNANRGSITYNRAGGVVAYNVTSDYRAKTLMGSVENPGKTIDALKVYRGVMNGATAERPMLVAHEAKEVAPYCVTGEKDAINEEGNPIYQQMDHQVLVPLLIAEIQQLRIRVAVLEGK